MQPYGNRSGISGVVAYEIGEDFVREQFYDCEPYRSSKKGVGALHLSELKRLPKLGEGLSTYISQHPEVRHGYDRDDPPG